MPIIVEPGLALTYPDSQIDTISARSGPGHYVISLNTLNSYWAIVERNLQSGSIVCVEKVDESCATIWHTVSRIEYQQWIAAGLLRFVTGGDASVVNFNSEHFLTMTLNSNGNRPPEINYTNNRPFTFLFTNKKIRPHRRYLITELKRQGLSDRALWSAKESQTTWGHPEFNREYTHQGFESQLLPAGYDPVVEPAWIDGMVYSKQYEHTWFSLIAETIVEYPYSFRTEKIYKPILAAHPFIVAANYGFYRDLRNQGFMSYNSVIDESFDLIEDNQTRLNRVIAEVAWLCKQNLVKFWQEVTETRLYNQKHLLELHSSRQKQFNNDFLKFIYA